MENKLIQMVSFSAVDTKNGKLVMFQGADVVGNNILPFEIKRVLVMRDMKPSDLRGGHTHRRTRQILFAIAGSCMVGVDDGKNKSQIKLTSFNEGIYLPPLLWHTMYDFAEGTVLLVLADTEYDENEYVRSYDDFLKLI